MASSLLYYSLMYPNVEKYNTDREVREILHETFGYPIPPVEEILRHKWIESEKAGRDIGLSTSIYDWKARHYDHWRQAVLRTPGTTRAYASSRTAAARVRKAAAPFIEEPVLTDSEGVAITMPMWFLAGLKNRLSL